jgi:hypothetical protein
MDFVGPLWELAASKILKNVHGDGDLCEREVSATKWRW